MPLTSPMSVSLRRSCLRWHDATVLVSAHPQLAIHLYAMNMVDHLGDADSASPGLSRIRSNRGNSILPTVMTIGPTSITAVPKLPDP